MPPNQQRLPAAGGNAAPRNRSLLRGRVLSAPGSDFRLAPVPRSVRPPDVAEKLRSAPVWGRAGTSSRGCPKTSSRAGFWEGHEFHSCRNRRPINSGFQPLGECRPANAFFRSLLRGRVLSAPGSGFRLAPVPRRARLPDVAEKLRSAPGTTSRRCPKTPFRAGFGKGTSSTRAVTAAQSTAASSRWGNAARETAACYAAESCPLPAAASVSRPFREGHDFQTLRKNSVSRRGTTSSCQKLRFAPGFGKGTSSTRAVTAAQSTAASSRWGNAAPRTPFPQPATRPSPVRSRQRLPSRARSAKGTTSRRCGKTPFRAGFWEGHEFHSCRNRRPINSGFQPLGECRPAKPQPAGGSPRVSRLVAGKGLSSRANRGICSPPIYPNFSKNKQIVSIPR